MRVFLLTGCALLALLTGCNRSTRPDAASTGGAQQAAAQDSQPATPDEQAAKPAAPAKIGDAAPDFTLTGSDGKTYKLADYREKTFVLEWFSKDCPTCKRQAGKLRDTAARLAKRDVTWLAIDSSHYRKAADNREYAAAEKLPYPILEDFDGRTGRAYGAKVTPHIFVIHRGKLAYSGALVKQAEERNYVVEAVEAILDGKEPPLTTTTPYG